VFIEDDADLRGDLDASSPLSTSPMPFSSSMLPPKSSKIDVYHMIVNNHLSSLRVNADAQIPPESPFSCLEANAEYDLNEVHRAFTTALSLQVNLPGGRRKSSATALPGKRSITPARGAPQIDITMKVTKVGLLSRKGKLISFSLFRRGL
jgi:hypothetical protein